MQGQSTEGPNHDRSLFVHLKKKKTCETYHFFASSLVGKHRELQGQQCFATDGEVALSDALATVFSSAINLCCLLHFHSNNEKLPDLHIPPEIALKFVHDILGKPSQLETGLMDAYDENELNAMIESLEDVWKHREEPFHFPSASTHGLWITAKTLSQKHAATSSRKDWIRLSA